MSDGVYHFCYEGRVPASNSIIRIGEQEMPQLYSEEGGEVVRMKQVFN